MSHGGSLAEFGRLRPWEVREVLERLEKRKTEEMNAKAQFDADVAKSTVQSIGNVIKALEGVAKRLDNLTKVVASKPSM